MKIQIACAKCKTVLGYYEGKQFWIAPALKIHKILCEKCHKQIKRDDIQWWALGQLAKLSEHP